MREYDLKLEKYEISKYAYRELKNFCLQYPENKHRIQTVLSLPAIEMTGMPHGSGVSNPTQGRALLYAMCKDECALIEETAKEVAGVMWKQLLKNVTENIAYEYMQIPCGRRQFFALRRRFFYQLALRKGKV